METFDLEQTGRLAELIAYHNGVDLRTARWQVYRSVDLLDISGATKILEEAIAKQRGG